MRTVDLLDLVKHLQELLFTSIVDIPPGLLFVLFFVGLLLGWLFGYEERWSCPSR